jgi:DNA-binding NarL/FixJ family response regulator
MTLKIFIVDDSMPIVVRLTNILSGEENLKIVGIANNATKAIEYIAKSNPDVVILNIHMPDGNGIDILKQIKKEKPSTIVLMLTNYTESDYRKICMKEGADFFLDKSIEFEKIIDICKTLAMQNNKTNITALNNLQNKYSK